MERLTCTERYTDEFENHYLSDVAESRYANKECLGSEQCVFSDVSKSINCEKICSGGYALTADENTFCSNSMASQVRPHNCLIDADVAEVCLDFTKGSREAMDNGGNTNSCTSSFEKVELLYENLSKMISNFKNCKTSCKKFCKVYPSWSHKREEVITQLKVISEGLNKVKWDSNVAKLVGSSVGVAGGIATVVGAALIPFTLGLSTPLMIGGMVTSGVGGATSLGTSVTEMCLLTQKIKKAQEIVKEDKEEFNILAELFDHADAYMRAFEDLLDHADAYMRAFKDLLDLDLVRKAIDAPELSSVLISKSKQKTPHLSLSSTTSNKSKEKTLHLPLSSTVAKTSVIETSGICKKIQDTVKGILPQDMHSISVPLSIVIAVAVNPELGKMFEEIRKLRFENPVVYEIISMIYRIRNLNLVNMQANCITCVNTAAKFGSITVSTLVSRSLSQALFAGLGLAIDVMSLTLTSIDFHKGSYCHSAESVRKVNEQLSSEYEILKSVYLELNKHQMNKDT